MRGRRDLLGGFCGCRGPRLCGAGEDAGVRNQRGLALADFFKRPHLAHGRIMAQDKYDGARAVHAGVFVGVFVGGAALGAAVAGGVAPDGGRLGVSGHVSGGAGVRWRSRCARSSLGPSVRSFVRAMKA